MSPEHDLLYRAALYGLALLLGLLLFHAIRSRAVRQGFLLLVSYALYVTWGPWFLLVLLASTVMNFLMGRWLRQQTTGGVLGVGLALNLGLLATFKYLPGMAGTVPLASLQKLAQIVLPLGISFWTFQAMSYLLDLYRGEELDPSFVEFALYMAFFPVVISGPICRLPDMLPQFRSQNVPTRHDMGRGICRIATGILMMQIAQLLGKGLLSGQGINGGFDRLTAWKGPDVWVLALGYGLQVFFDFAGYSHIAIGTARMLGFTLPENFARPFASSTVSVFWTRWHMSLSFWIRDYVFMPLAVMLRQDWWRKACLLIAMVLFGVWHKGTILFVLFGCYHGVVLILHRQAQQAQRSLEWEPAGRLWTVCCWALTMAVISLGWIFFRSNSLAQAQAMFASLLSPRQYAGHVLHWSLYALVAVLAAGYAAALAVVDALDKYAEELESATSRSGSEAMVIAVRDRWVWLAPLWGAACVLMITLLPQSRAANVFLYRSF